MLDPWLFLLYTLVATSVLFVLLWLWCERIGNAGYIDVAWAFMIGVAVIAGVFVLETDAGRQWLVGLMGAFWAWRLAYHLYKRIHGKPEDSRYVYMREYFAGKASLAFFVFFQMQAVFVVLFLAPMVAAMTAAGPLGFVEIFGVLIWFAAFGGEAVADRQLAAFKKDPANEGKVCKQGLWRYSRHPNYFFEWVHWFAYLVIGARLSDSIGYAALAGPVVMLVFLLFVTGLPYVEKRALASKGEAYRQYQRETSAFVPWFVRKA